MVSFYLVALFCLWKFDCCNTRICENGKMGYKCLDTLQTSDDIHSYKNKNNNINNKIV